MICVVALTCIRSQFLGSQSRASFSSFASEEVTSVTSQHEDEVDGLAPADTTSHTAQKGISDEELNKPVLLELQETPVMWLLDLPGTWVLPDSDEAVDTTASNERYAQRLERTKTASDAFSSRAAQTINDTLKDKETQATAAKTTSTGSQFTSYELHDTWQAVHADPTAFKSSVNAIVMVGDHRSLFVLPHTQQDAIAEFTRGRVRGKDVAMLRAPDAKDTSLQPLVSLLDALFLACLDQKAGAHHPRASGSSRRSQPLRT
jgi:hypothetical protein